MIMGTMSHNLLKFFESVNKHLDKGFPVDIMYLDFLKAFDKNVVKMELPWDWREDSFMD